MKMEDKGEECEKQRSGGIGKIHTCVVEKFGKKEKNNCRRS